ncbi:MAG: penicillin-binding protein 2 [wastewater metagenome]|nr:penicillin-binding protein 2 [Candidatus Loosdrechtia aerotolerans]
MYPNRFKILFIFFSLLFIGIVIRLFQLQVIECDKYRGISNNRRITTSLLETIRGSIFDRNGRMLAVDRHTFDVSVHYNYLLYCYFTHTDTMPPRIADLKVHKNTQKTCKECHGNQDIWLERLSKLLEIPQAKLLDNAEQIVKRVERLKQSVEQRSGRKIRIKEEVDHHPVVSDVAWEKVIQIETQQDNFPGIRIVPKSKRIYPEQELASHIIGHTGKLTEDEWKKYSNDWNNYVLTSHTTNNETASTLYDGYMKNDLVGRTGVEAQYEKELRGMRGKRFEEITCKGSQIEKTILERPSISGNDIYLTIDSQIQAHAESLLGTYSGSIIVIDPWTGEILAMANNPRFNLNMFNKNFSELISHPSKPFLNRAIQGTLPPGSVFKIITAIAALDTDQIDTQTAFKCQGSVHYKNTILRCWLNYGHGSISIKDAIAYSCNVFFFEIAKALQGKHLYAYAKLFGIGEKTGVDLPYEKRGSMPRAATTVSAMNIAIGQGTLLTTPLQLIRAFAAIANGGTLVQPHVLLKVTNSEGKTVQVFKPENERKISLQPSILTMMQTSLQGVVTYGTGKGKGLDVYKVAGKTGTAETGHKNDNHAWFVGYAPYDNPRYCFLILIEHTPKHASEITCPLAEKLLSHLFPEITQAS